MTPRKEPPSRLEIEIKHTQRLVEGLALRTELLDQHLVKLTEKIEAITDQVGLFTEGLTRIGNLIERQENKLDRILDAIQNQTKLAEAQAKTAEAQAANIATLSRLVEMLVSRN